jgi:hypothetical protein
MAVCPDASRVRPKWNGCRTRYASESRAPAWSAALRAAAAKADPGVAGVAD